MTLWLQSIDYKKIETLLGDHHLGLLICDKGVKACSLCELSVSSQCCCSASFLEVFPEEWHTTQLNQAWLTFALISRFPNWSISAWNELCALGLYRLFLNLKMFFIEQKESPLKGVKGDVINQLAIRYLGLARSNTSSLDLCLLCESHWNLIKEYSATLILEIWVVFWV